MEMTRNDISRAIELAREIEALLIQSACFVLRSDDFALRVERAQLNFESLGLAMGRKVEERETADA